MVVTIRAADPVTVGRIAQLTQKTNQFNMTTKRYLETDIALKAESNDFRVLSIGLKDKFEDMGIVGVAIIETAADAWRIDSFLMSCRAIGRKAEEAFLAYILKEALRRNIRKVTGEFKATPKNAPAKDFYKNNGFRLAKREENVEFWDYDTSAELPFPICITLDHPKAKVWKN
jgi:FkbH-like protein